MRARALLPLSCVALLGWAAPETDQPYLVLGPLAEPVLVGDPPPHLPEVRWVDGASVRTVPGASLPAVAQAALAATREEARPGAEIDLWVYEDDAPPTPVTVRWEPSGRWQVTTAPVASAAEPPSEEAVEARWGVSLGAVGDARWTPQQLALVDRALAQMPPADRACVVDVPILRTDAPPGLDPSGVMVAAYRFGVLQPPQILLYKTDLEDRDTTFFGTPADPQPAAVHLLLHELAHAVGDAAERRAHAPLVPLLAELAAAQDALRAAGALTGDRIDSVVAPALTERLRAAQTALEERGHSPQTLGAAWGLRQGPAAVERTWGQRMAGRWRPSRYAETDDIEGFAEVLGLWWADPAAMQWALPDMAAWFEAGNHRACAPTPDLH